MLAIVCGYETGKLLFTFGDIHIYDTPVDQVKLQLSRKPKKLPLIHINPNIKNINDFEFEDFELIDYDPHPAIPAPVSV